MAARPSRPFYGRFGWAYDLLITDPVEPFVDRVGAALAARGIVGGSLLDAGSGTGRYAIEISRRGFTVTAIDSSPDLVEQARAKEVPRGMHVAFRVGDILRLEPTGDFDAVLCRGVLNDVTDEADRGTAIESLARSLRPGGALILDVRDLRGSIERVTREPLVEHRVQIGDRVLVYRAVRHIDEPEGLIVSTEEFVLTTPAGVERLGSTFAMKPWTEGELRARLVDAGFRDIDCAAGWRHRNSATVTDRIFCAATRN